MINKNQRIFDPLYQPWLGMRKKCLNEKSPQYKNYGGIGCRIAKEWTDFDTFRDTCPERPSEEHHLALKKGCKVFNAKNCLWVTADHLRREKAGRKKETDLPRGVTQNVNKYIARITISGKLTYLGSFQTIEEARDAYIEAKDIAA